MTNNAADREAAHREMTSLADQLMAQRIQNSPAIKYLVANGLFESNSDFVDWDKRLWDLTDLILRDQAGLQDEGDVGQLLTKVRKATSGLPEELDRIHEFKSRPWWPKVEFSRVED